MLLAAPYQQFTGSGSSVFDLEDWAWRDAYDSGESPKEAFGNFVEEMGYGEG